MSKDSRKRDLVRKELFIDDRFVDEITGLVRRFHRPTKCPENPVIHADQPWERDAAFIDTGLVIYDEKEQIFKAWYQGGACYGPDDGSNMCYATSADGVHWDKPSLGVVEFEGSKDNNIALLPQCMMHDPAPILDCVDPDPQKRYKAMWWGGRKDPSQKGGWLLGHCVAFSPDGIHWTEHPDNPIWVGDAEGACPFGLERREGKFVMYNTADGYGMRVTVRTESDDFIHWDLPSKLVFGYDEVDPPGTEMAGMSSIDYDGTLIGMLWVINNLPQPTAEQWGEILDKNIRQGFLGPPIAMNAAKCRTFHTELVTSIDGVYWQRVCRRTFLPLGSEGSWDECFQLVSRPFVANDRIYIYYTGQGRTGQIPGQKKPQPISEWSLDTGLATLRMDGWASLETDSVGGTVLTKVFELKGTDLQVNVDAGNGSLRLEVLDEHGKSVPGFGANEASPISEDQLLASATWTSKQNVADLVGKRVKLKLHLKNANLYSISIVNQM